MLKKLREFLADESGPTAVEYAVMLALIVGGCIVSVNTLAQSTGDSFDNSATELQGVLGN